MAAVSAYVKGRRGLSRQIIDFDPVEDAALVAPPAGAMVAAGAPAGVGALRGVAGALHPLWPAGLAPTPSPGLTRIRRRLCRRRTMSSSPGPPPSSARWPTCSRRA